MPLRYRPPPNALSRPSGELAEQIDKLLRNIFANRFLVGAAKRVRNVRVMPARVAFARSRCLLVASGTYFGCLVGCQTERPPLNVIVQPHFSPVALKTSPREDLYFWHLDIGRKRNESQDCPGGKTRATVKPKPRMFVPQPG